MIEKTHFQRTIGGPCALSGKGLHTGMPAVVHLRPGAERTGIRFFKKGRPLPVDEAGAGVHPGSRCSRVGRGEFEILTVEHLLAALSAFQITNLEVDVDGPEVPALDGSSAGFVEALRTAGVVDQQGIADCWRITEPIVCSESGKSIAIFPADTFSVEYVLDYPFPGLRDQRVEFEVTPEIFAREIAPARTFCTEPEIEAVRSAGLGLGADGSNTLVVDKQGRFSSAVRFSDECARHKVLDIIGDLQLTGFRLLGRVVGIRSGHALNRKLVQAIQQQRKTMETMDTETIKSILPHRDPFLFLDKVVARGERTLTAVKKLTGEEEFFKGHFPGKPVMPGVLMVEALAQAGGVLLLAKQDAPGKIVYLASVTNARFRKVVVPGDEMFLEIEVLKVKTKVGTMRGAVKVRGEVACEAEIMFSVGN